MPTPSTPSLSVTAPTSTSLTVTFSDSNASSTNTLYYRRLGQTADTAGPARTGDGTVTLNNLTANFGYLLYGVSSLGGYLSLPAFTFATLLQPGDTLLGAVQYKWSLLPDLSLIAGPLFANEIPESLEDEKLTLPYTAVSADETMVAHAFEKVKFEETRLTFNIYCLGAQLAETAGRLLDEYFNLQDLTFTSTSQVTNVLFRNTNYSVRNTFTRYRDGSLIYHARLEYEALIQRFRP